MIFKSYLVLACLFLASCASTPKSQYEKGYRQSVQQEVKQVVAQFHGGNFPFYHWSSPIVQEVLVPARLSNGVMIPEHKQLVIIKPGEWIHSGAYPIKSQEGKGYDNQISYMDMDVADIDHPSSGK